MAGRRRQCFARTVGCAFILVLLLSSLTATGVRPESGLFVTASGASMMGGLLASESAQTVNGSGYWVPFCTDATTVNCIVPVGVDYVPATGVLLVTEQSLFGYPNDMRASNAFQEFSPSIAAGAALGPVQNLSCPPRAPYYPGAGPYVYAPCASSPYVYVIDTETDAVVANISTPFPVVAMTLDAQNGLIYMGGSGALAALNPRMGAVAPVANQTGALFSPDEGVGIGTQLVFDPATDRLITFSGAAQLLSVDPTTGAVENLRGLPADPTAIGIAPQSGDLFVTIPSFGLAASYVLVFSTTTYDLVGNLSIPWCVENFCGGDGTVTEFVVDPAHGDVYFASGLALFAVNLTSLSIVGSVLNVGDGFSGSATYVPSYDRIYGTYQLVGEPGPGYLVEMTHGNTTVLTGFFWLPVASGILAVGGLVGLAAAVASGARRPRSGSPLSPEDPRAQ